MPDLYAVHFVFSGPAKIDKSFTLPEGRYRGKLSFMQIPMRDGVHRQLGRAMVNLTTDQMKGLGADIGGAESIGIDVARFVKNGQVICEESPDAGQNLVSPRS